MTPAPPPFDALVVGAGFGGLGAAIALARGGGRVCLCESLRYPGGCASTFSKAGGRFDAGATLVSGLGPDQLFGKWLARYAPDTRLEWMDPLVELRAPGLELPIVRDRGALVDRFCAMPGAPASGVRAFFSKQRAVAETLWPLFDDPDLLPPFSFRSLLRHTGRAHRYAALAPLLGRTLQSVLEGYGLSGFAPLRLYVDALCQITVQCSASEAEATFALAAMDYYYRGTAHVHGGVGTLAEALLAGARAEGVDVRMPNRVTALARDADGTWIATTRRGEIRARAIVANLVPAALLALLPPPLRRASLEAKARAIEDAWGAAMFYAIARAPKGERQEAHHLQLVADPAHPLAEGNHVFCSVSSAAEAERAPAGRRTLTLSTHVPLARLRAAGAEAGRYIQSIQDTMRRTFTERAPEWSEGIELSLPASPRTFARFVGRPAGAVGGLPRRASLSAYSEIGPRQVLDDLWLVGDSVFPGQSALAAAIGGIRTAVDVARGFGVSPSSERARQSEQAPSLTSSKTGASFAAHTDPSVATR